MSACFDVEQVEVTESAADSLIDDFEDGDQVSPVFGGWYCFAYDDGEGLEYPFTCDGSSPGLEGDFAQSVSFDVPSKVWVGLGTNTLGTVDLSSFSELRLSATLESSDLGLRVDTVLSVELFCETVLAPGSQDFFTVSDSADLRPDSLSISFSLSDFRQPSFQEVRIDPSACLRVTDGLSFFIEPGLVGVTNGTFTIDDVSLE